MATERGDIGDIGEFTEYDRALAMNAPDDDVALRAVLDEVVSPLVAEDNGRVTFVRRVGDVVEVRFGGACRGCPGQSFTVKGVVLPALQRVDATVREVRVVY